jgi:hypothetical protein
VESNSKEREQPITDSQFRWLERHGRMGNGKTLDENWLEEKEAELLCECGSGLYWERKYDAQGIYLCRVCDQCRVAKLRGYRPEILSHYTQADVDEPIDEN